MKLIVPQSLVNAMSRSSLVDYKPIDVLMNLPETIKLISSYEGQHGYVPKEWSMFLDNLKEVLTQLTQENQEIVMTNLIELEAKRTQWISKLVFSGKTMSETELRALSMVELRDLYEEVFPSYITMTSATATGGSKKLVTKISKAA